MTNGVPDDIEGHFNVCFSDFSKWRLVLTDRNNHTWLNRAEKVSVYAICHLQPPAIVLLVELAVILGHLRRSGYDTLSERFVGTGRSFVHILSLPCT